MAGVLSTSARTLRPYALAAPETPIVSAGGAGRYNASLQPMRSFFRCLISAQARTITRIETLCDKLAQPERLTEEGFQRLYAILSDLIAARSAYSRWKTACSLNWGHLGPKEELSGFREMLALTLKYDLSLEDETNNVSSALLALHVAMEARAKATAGATQAADVLAALHPSEQLLAACERLRVSMHHFAALKREALSFDSTRLLGWVSQIFDKRLSEHALQTLLYGPVVPLREAASVCRWTLRNQVPTN